LTDCDILVTNGEGEDDGSEWHLSDFGRDGDYSAMWAIYRRLAMDGKYAYSGGWAEQLAVHIEIIDLFRALDASVEYPKAKE